MPGSVHVNLFSFSFWQLTAIVPSTAMSAMVVRVLCITIIYLELIDSS